MVFLRSLSGALSENLKKKNKLTHMIFQRLPQGALSENKGTLMFFLRPPPQGALSENLTKSYWFPAVPPGGPSRKSKEFL